MFKIFANKLMTAALVVAAATVSMERESVARTAAAEHATAAEIALLPKYCMGTYQPKEAKTPQQNIVNCGGFMNHFCDTLVLLNRVVEPGRDKGDKKWLIGHARLEMGYTLKNMTPNCPIAADVRAADTRLRVYEQLYK